ncbi:MAG: hypothetical protein C5B57_11175 [Blastocatellia bacterium]|nr:MAG: hypothetical protein C5B57_11175 [Blastocatellia bacterium]
MTGHARFRLAWWSALLLGLSRVALLAHSGPPFPIVSNQAAGPYEISIWTDPDSTDDGSAAGQFWVVVHGAGSSRDVPATTRAHVSIMPLDRPGSELTVRTEPIAGDVSRQFAVLVMDHEGRFRVRVAVEGPLGTGAVESEVDATYDLRPRPILMVLYLAPFLMVGFLWLKLLVRRRHVRRPRPR